jgi:hypothetical protein
MGIVIAQMNVCEGILCRDAISSPPFNEPLYWPFPMMKENSFVVIHSHPVTWLSSNRDVVIPTDSVSLSISATSAFRGRYLVQGRVQTPD